MDLTIAATSFALVFPVELPDKTFVASLVLATRFRPLPVWLGVASAFLLQTLVAVTAGGLIGRLPDVVVTGAAGALFAVGAVVLWRGATDEHVEVATTEGGQPAGDVPAPPWRAASTSFGVLFLAEWGDLSQLLTAGLAARYDEPVSVFAGSWLALVTVAGLAVLLGQALLRRVRLGTVRRVGALICLTLALLAGYDVVRALA